MNWVIWTLVAGYVATVRGCSSKRAIYLPRISKHEDREPPTGGWTILDSNLTALYPNLIEPLGRAEFLVKQSFTVVGYKPPKVEMLADSSVILTKFGAVYDRLWYRKWRAFRDRA